MKKYLNISLLYAIAAMVAGVFYREFTKLQQFSGVTTLGKVHVHLFLLGMIIFMLVALFVKETNVEESKTFHRFLLLYNIGVPLTCIMMVVRGITQVFSISLSNGASAAISGIAGIGHIMSGAGIIMLLIALKNSQNN